MENSLNYQPVADRYERMPYKYCGKVVCNFLLSLWDCGIISAVWTISR